MPVAMITAPKDKLRFTFELVNPDEDPLYDPEMRRSYRTLTCDNIGQISVTIYVWDEEGNYEFCETYVLSSGFGCMPWISA